MEGDKITIISGPLTSSAVENSQSGKKKGAEPVFFLFSLARKGLDLGDHIIEAAK